MIETVKVLGIIDLIKTIDINDSKNMKKWTENLFGHEIIIDSNNIIIKRENNIKKEQDINREKINNLQRNIRNRKLLKSSKIKQMKWLIKRFVKVSIQKYRKVLPHWVIKILQSNKFSLVRY